MSPPTRQHATVLAATPPAPETPDLLIRPSAFARYRAQNNFGSLDGIRCLSILPVIWHHSVGGYRDIALTKNGFLGVDMFFVLSGFLIVTLLLRERDERGSISLPAFYLRRTLRIFPLYYGVLVLMTLRFAVVSPHHEGAREFLSRLPYYLTYTSNWVVAPGALALTWSLATEEQFYLVWPACERFLSRRLVPVLLVGFIAVNQAVNFGLLDRAFSGWIGEHRFQLNILQTTFTPILLGVALAHTLHRARGFAAVDRWLGRRWASVVMLGLVIAAASMPGNIAGWPRLVMQLLMTGFLASCVVREGHVLRPVLASRPFRAIGLVSYGMYLLHVFMITPASRVLERVHLDWGLPRFVLCAGLTFVVAGASFLIYERPFLKLKSRLRRKRHPHAT